VPPDLADVHRTSPIAQAVVGGRLIEYDRGLATAEQHVCPNRPRAESAQTTI
jgi:hypothetical protein